MKNNILLMISALLSVVAVQTLAVSCEGSSPEADVPSGPHTPAEEDTAVCYGSYVFGEDTCAVRTVRTGETESYWYIFLSPLQDTVRLEAYAVFGLKKYWCDGQEYDINDPLRPLSHNDDYYFVYEDPVHYYSQFRRFQEGKVRMSVSADYRFDVSVDALLIDGTPFVMDIEGVFPPSGTGL